jgi:protein Hikeshi
MSNAFGIIPAGLPLITEPSSAPSQTSFLYALPSAKPFSHIVVFLLPSITLPPGTAAAIYVSPAADVARGSPNFRFLGGIGPGKESAMFKVGGGHSAAHDLVLGIDVESEAEVGAKLQELAASKAAGGGETGQPSTAVLAQRIIQNAFNFLASFSGTAGPGGVEVVPLKAFEAWWKKFESRVKADPSFLEKQQD